MERKKVLITQVSEPKSGISKPKDGQTEGHPWTVWSFKSKEETGSAAGNELAYQTMSKIIGSKLVVNLECEIEFETYQRTSGENTYIDRKVSQMYISGEPVVKKGEGNFKQKDYKSDPAKLASIEKQQALICATTFCTPRGDLYELLKTATFMHEWLRIEPVKNTAPAVKDTAIEPKPPPCVPNALEKPLFSESGEVIWDTKTVEGFAESLKAFRGMKKITQEQWDTFKVSFHSIWKDKTRTAEFTQAQRALLAKTLQEQFK